MLILKCFLSVVTLLCHETLCQPLNTNHQQRFVPLRKRIHRETYLTSEDFQRARIHPPVDLPAGKGTQLRRDLFEGCIKNLKSSKLNSFVSTGNVQFDIGKNGRSILFGDPIPDRYQLWPNGRIPYAISNQFTPQMRTMVAAAIQDFHDYTCVKFVRRQTSDSNYLFITPGHPGEGCYSDTVGRAGGRQIVNLDQPGCGQRGTAVHELLHVAGFFHEHSRSDRDTYINVRYENINPGDRIQFTKHSIPTLEALNSPYDYYSVMHYPRDAFSMNGRDTILPRKGGVQIGQRVGFSPTDADELNRLYCPGFAAKRKPAGPNVEPRPIPGRPSPVLPTGEITEVIIPPQPQPPPRPPSRPRPRPVPHPPHVIVNPRPPQRRRPPGKPPPPFHYRHRPVFRRHLGHPYHGPRRHRGPGFHERRRFHGRGSDFGPPRPHGLPFPNGRGPPPDGLRAIGNLIRNFVRGNFQ